MDRYGGRPSGVTDAVDVVGREVESLAWSGSPLHGRSVQSQPLLHHLSLHHRHRAARNVVIVEARVVSLHPADHPGRHLVVVAKQLECALSGVVVHQVLPQLGAGRVLTGEFDRVGHRLLEWMGGGARAR